MNANAFAFLQQAMTADGGWGYSLDQASSVEATAAVALAAQDDLADADLERSAVAWLRAAQHADGGWGMNKDDIESIWTTGWGVLALTSTGSAEDAVARGAVWLARMPALRVTDDELQEEFRRKLAVDPNLSGWPWLPDEASWIEPTALILLALAAAPVQGIAARSAEAARFIADRRCQGGGWNFGNPVMLGGNLPPRAHPTAWALLALNRVAPDLIRSEDLAALRTEAGRDGGSSALALALLALRTLGEDDPALASRLAGRQAAGGGWDGNPYHTALALLAGRGRLL